MAAAGGLTLPALKGVPPSFVHAAGRPLAASLAIRLLETDLADAADWKDVAGDPVAFLNRTLQRWSRSAGGDVVGDDFIGVAAGVFSDIRQFFWGEAHDQTLERMWIAFGHTGSHDIIEMRHVTKMLERWHPRLAATFHHHLVDAMNTVAFVWDAGWAKEWLYMYGDWVVEQAADAAADGEEEELWPIDVHEGKDFPVVTVREMRLPELTRQTLSNAAVRKLKLPARERKIMGLILELRAAAKAVDTRGRYPRLDEFDLYDVAYHSPPTLVIPMERYDAIERSFDEENMALGQGGEAIPPLQAFYFDATDDDELRWARETFVAVTRVFALAAELMPLLPTRDPDTLAESLVELEVAS